MMSDNAMSGGDKAKKRARPNGYNAAEASQVPEIVPPIVSIGKIELGISKALISHLMRTFDGKWLASTLKAYSMQVTDAAILLESAYETLVDKLRQELDKKKSDLDSSHTMVKSVNEAQSNVLYLDVGGETFHTNQKRADLAPYLQLLAAHPDPDPDTGYHFVDRQGDFWSQVVWPGSPGLIGEEDVLGQQEREHRFANSNLLLPIQELRELRQFIAATIDLLLPFTKDGQFLTRTREQYGVVTTESVYTNEIPSDCVGAALKEGAYPLTFTLNLKLEWQEMTKSDRNTINETQKALKAKLSPYGLSVAYLLSRVQQYQWWCGENEPILDIIFPYSHKT